jgi:hypothetical protein
MYPFQIFPSIYQNANLNNISKAVSHLKESKICIQFKDQLLDPF